MRRLWFEECFAHLNGRSERLVCSSKVSDQSFCEETRWKMMERQQIETWKRWESLKKKMGVKERSKKKIMC